MSHQPPKYEEVLKRWKHPRNVNDRHKEQMSGLDKLAVAITQRIGTMGFFIIIFVWTVLWLGWNFLAPEKLRFDPPMGFVLWLFISNMIQIFLMPLLMISQNIESRHSELRSQSDYETNTKAEQEIEVLLQHLDYQNTVLQAIAKKIDINLEELMKEGNH